VDEGDGLLQHGVPGVLDPCVDDQRMTRRVFTGTIAAAISTSTAQRSPTSRCAPSKQVYDQLDREGYAHVVGVLDDARLACVQSLVAADASSCRRRKS
jgi:hypothetical protein